MTRAILLQLLAHPAALGEADVRALEQLAAAFPYCQTAHLLLAKAAHDHGSMLAGQRLRRAATYAADRTRLRELIELPTGAETLATASEIAAQAAIPALAAAPLAWAEIPAHENAPVWLAGKMAAESSPAESAVAATTAGAGASESDGQLSSELPHDLPEQHLAPLAEVPTPAAETVDNAAVAEAAETKAATEPELPAQAPPIRPPAGATAAAEFGLAEVSPVELAPYRLPEADVNASSAPALAELSIITYPAFTGGVGVGYALSEGGRWGYCLVAANAESSAGNLAGCLPPTGEFFAPDALLLEHLATVPPPPAAPKASSLDLIESFLRRTPAVTRRRGLPTPPDAAAQADLSVRSTRAEADLASEGLAKILARQGKTERAIAVYERLMVKHPEKMAYFAAQIDSLRPSA